MARIIDAHTHLGDILFEGGGALIWQPGVRKRLLFDPFVLSEMLAFRWCLPDRIFCSLFPAAATRVQHARNAMGTYENFRSSMDRAGIDASVAMPIPPQVVFDDLAPVHRMDPAVIPFTGADFTAAQDWSATFARDVERGARGLKLHPILQGVSLDSAQVHEAVEAFAPFGLPVLFHCGVTSYFHGEDRKREVPELGRTAHAAVLVRDFPGVSFIAGHAGLDEADEVIGLLSRMPNVWVDTSFQSPGVIRRLMNAFGRERVLFASDWPWGSRSASLRAVRIACRGDLAAEEKVLGANAAALMKLTADW